MEYTINELRQKVFSQVYSTYNIFKDFFGEEYVDLQHLPDDRDVKAVLDCCCCPKTEHEGYWEISEDKLTHIQVIWQTWVSKIYVWWPEVTVTNEYDKSILIKDLYAEIPITVEARIPVDDHGLRMTRSTYTADQWSSGYCHSHIPSFDWRNGAPTFRLLCLGSAPINRIVINLKTDSDMMLWMSFCQELALCVTVESLTGGPYLRLEYVGNSKKIKGKNDYYHVYETLYEWSLKCDLDLKKRERDFIAYYLKHGHLTFNYYKGTYTCSMPYYNFIMDISNCFIQWFNKTGSATELKSLYEEETLTTVQVDDGVFYEPNGMTDFELNNIRQQKILTFKGKDIMLRVEKNQDQAHTSIIVLNHAVALYLLQNILKTINYRYRNEHQSIAGRKTDSPAPTYQKAFYL